MPRRGSRHNPLHHLPLDEDSHISSTEHIDDDDDDEFDVASSHSQPPSPAPEDDEPEQQGSFPSKDPNTNNKRKDPFYKLMVDNVEPYESSSKKQSLEDDDNTKDPEHHLPLEHQDDDDEELRHYTSRKEQAVARLCCRVSVACCAVLLAILIAALLVWLLTDLLEFRDDNDSGDSAAITTNNTTDPDSNQTNRTDGAVVPLAGVSNCQNVPQPLYWPTELSGTTTMLGDTRTSPANNHTIANFCGLVPNRKGLWYTLRGQETRYRLTVRPQATSTPFRVSVLRGTCDPATGTLSTSETLQCLGSGNGEVEFYGATGVLYHVYVQGHGAYTLTVQRGWVLHGVIAGVDTNATLGVSVALSETGRWIAASAPFASSQQEPGQIRFWERNETTLVYHEHDALLAPDSNATLFGLNLALSADGHTLAVMQSDALRVYEQIVGNALSWNATLVVTLPNTTLHKPGSVCLSPDGTTVAWNVHVPHEARGYIEVYEHNATGAWNPKGPRIPHGTFAAGNVYDKAVALSHDGQILVAAGPHRTARVFQWNSTSEEWNVWHNHVLTDVTSVALTGSGQCVAAARGGNQDTQVRVYCYSNNTNTTVQQVGQTLSLPTKSDSNFGHSVSFSQSGRVLAVGAPWYDATSSRRDSGRLYLYQYDKVTSVWHTAGVLETSLTGDLYGWSTHVSYDGSTVVVGAPFSGPQRAGMVQVARVFV